MVNIRLTCNLLHDNIVKIGDTEPFTEIQVEIDLEAGVYDDSSYKPGTC